MIPQEIYMDVTAHRHSASLQPPASGGISGGVDTEPAIEQGGVTGVSRA
jgi:hypothetical protein